MATASLDNLTSIKIGKKLGEGSYGKVSEMCFDNNERASYAVKTIRPIDAIQEINVSTSIPYHQNIMRIDHSYLSEDGNCLLAMPLMHYTLVYFIENKRFPTIQFLCRIMVQLCLAINFIHENGFIHSDLKPNNILFDLIFGCIRVIDFGLSKHWKPGMCPIKQKTFAINYRPPLLMQGYTNLSDVWAMGIIFIELASGKEQIIDYIMNILTIGKINIKTFLGASNSGIFTHPSDDRAKKLESIVERIRSKHVKRNPLPLFFYSIVDKMLSPLEKSRPSPKMILEQLSRDAKIYLSSDDYKEIFEISECDIIRYGDRCSYSEPIEKAITLWKTEDIPESFTSIDTNIISKNISYRYRLQTMIYNKMLKVNVKPKGVFPSLLFFNLVWLVDKFLQTTIIRKWVFQQEFTDAICAICLKVSTVPYDDSLGANLSSNENGKIIMAIIDNLGGKISNTRIYDLIQQALLNHFRLSIHSYTLINDDQCDENFNDQIDSPRKAVLKIMHSLLIHSDTFSKTYNDTEETIKDVMEFVYEEKDNWVKNFFFKQLPDPKKISALPVIVESDESTEEETTERSSDERKSEEMTKRSNGSTHSGSWLNLGLEMFKNINI